MSRHCPVTTRDFRFPVFCHGRASHTGGALLTKGIAMRLDQIPSTHLRLMLQATERDPYGRRSAEIIRRALAKRLELEKNLDAMMSGKAADA